MLNQNIKIDLHIHSKASAYKEVDGYVDESKIENIDVLLSKAQENNVNLISITAHNNFDYALYKKIIVIELEYKSTKYLFMGDATTEVEKMVKWNQVDVLKVAHHGSNSSTSQLFLEKVKPKYAIISVGRDNSHNLPDIEIKK